MADTPEPTLVDGTKSHVRTYASDVATLTGKPLPAKVENVPAPAPKPIAAPVAPKPVDPVVAPVQEPVTIPEPVRPAPPTPIITPAFTLPINPEKAATIERLKAKVGQPAGPSPIHTYKSDFAEHVEEQRASPLSVLAAQQDAAKPAPVVLTAKKKFPAELVGGMLLILIGIAAVAAAYLYITRDRIVEEIFVPSLIFADERVSLAGSAEELRAQLANPPKAAELALGEVLVTYITYSTTTEGGKTTIELAASGGSLVDALRLPAPDILLRNILPESTVGVVRAGEETRPFFILKVDSYERTYAGMLTWEASMEQDLAVFYPQHPSEPATTTLESFRLSFVDAIVDNRDVRVLKDAENRTIILYGYRDKDTLVIARNEAAFSELLARLAATRAQ